MVVPEWLIMLSIPLILTYQIAYFCDIALKLLNLLSGIWKKSEESFSFLIAFGVIMLLLMKFLFYLESIIVFTSGRSSHKSSFDDMQDYKRNPKKIRK